MSTPNTTTSVAPTPKPIDAVQTLVCTIPGAPLADVLKTFQGRRSDRTVAAARRIGAKPRTVKVPRNLLRQLFRLTGGWKEGQGEGWQACGETPPTDNRNVRYTSLRVGDMEVVFYLDSCYAPAAWICYRRTFCAKLSPDYQKERWLDKAKVAAAVASLGTPWPSPVPTS